LGDLNLVLGLIDRSLVAVDRRDRHADLKSRNQIVCSKVITQR